MCSKKINWWDGGEVLDVAQEVTVIPGVLSQKPLTSEREIHLSCYIAHFYTLLSMSLDLSSISKSVVSSISSYVIEFLTV